MCKKQGASTDAFTLGWSTQIHQVQKRMHEQVDLRKLSLKKVKVVGQVPRFRV
jgi:hypothetical protein